MGTTIVLGRTGVSQGEAALVVTVALLLSITAAGNMTAWAGTEASEDVRVVLYHIEADAGAAANITYTMWCPPQDQCSLHAFLLWPNGHSVHITNIHRTGNISTSVSTLAGSLQIPILTYPHGGVEVRFRWDDDDIGPAGSYYFGIIATHPIHKAAESVTGGRIVGTAAANDVRWYRVSDLPGVAGVHAGVPGSAVGVDLEWYAEEGTYAFFQPFRVDPVIYVRSGEAGSYRCGALAVVDWPPALFCWDDFFGGPGWYRMQIPLVFDEFNQYIAAKVDMPIPWATGGSDDRCYTSLCIGPAS